MSLVIVLKINLTYRRTFDSERQSMVASDDQTPHPFSIALERMQPPTRNCFELRNILRLLDCSQHRSKLCFMLPRNTARLLPPPQPFQVLVPEAGDAHDQCTVSA